MKWVYAEVNSKNERVSAGWTLTDLVFGAVFEGGSNWWLKHPDGTEEQSVHYRTSVTVHVGPFWLWVSLWYPRKSVEEVNW